MNKEKTEKKIIEDIKRTLSESYEKVSKLRSSYGYMLAVALIASTLSIVWIAYGVISSVSEGGQRAYLAGTSKDVAEYKIGDVSEVGGEGSGDVTMIETCRVIRGTEVTRLDEEKTVGDVKYIKIRDKSAAIREAGALLRKGSDKTKPYQKYRYVREEELSDSIDDVVRETEVYVRTPVTVYAEAEGPSIAYFIPKGTCLKVKGFDSMGEDGSVNKYKIEYTGDDGKPYEGYVYGKYLTDTQEKADAVYNDNGIYDKVKKDKYGMQLYGGKATQLDYYPYEKPAIEGNEFCYDARTMYLNCAAAAHPKRYIKLINETDCNAVVCDIKDGVLAYKSEVAKERSPRSYKTAYVSKKEYKKGIDALRDSGVYLIGRIVVFNDPIYAKDHPEDCIIWGKNTGWPSAYSRDVWEYNVRLAQEAIEEFGFNEIQFDYVRFPENSYEMSKSGLAKFRNRFGEEKGQAVQNFIFYAADQIHESGAYFSVDVFGESAYGYMTAYGQYWPGISNIVDAISAMPYTDHMGGEGSWENPYGTMKAWSKKAAKRQAYLENPAAARTWITGYNTPHWDPTVNYGKKQLKAQIRALEEEGLDGGFIPWNAQNNLGKYYEYKDIWNAE